MHAHTVYEVMDGELLQTLVKAVLSANFFWTRIGLAEDEALDKLVGLMVQLKDVLCDFMAREKEQYLLAARQIRHLKEAIHSVTADLETLIGEQALTDLIRSLNQQESPAVVGADQKVDSYLRVQKAALKVRLQALLRARSQRLQAFDGLKGDCMDTVRRLGLTTTEALEPAMVAILQERVANYEEVEGLQQATNLLQAQLEERIAHCQALSSEVLQIGQLIPVENIDRDDRLMNTLLEKKSADGEGDGDCAGKEVVVYSDKRLHKLKKLHTEVHLMALKTWTELKETSAQLGKLYHLFEVVAPESRHPHFNIVEAVQVKLSEQLQEQGQQQQQEQVDQTEEEETTEPLSDSLLQTLLPFFTDQSVTLKEALKNLGAELAFYSQQKSERISELIVACRAQFARQLADCLVCVEALRGDGRFGFLFTGPEHFDEHLLDVHQAELDRLRQYALKHEAILSLLAKWRRLKEEAAQLEAEMATGAHIRNNRGGILEKMLAKQRANKKQLMTATGQIGTWLTKQRVNSGGAGQQQQQPKTELDRLLPFELYTLRVEDIEREVGPLVVQRVHHQQQSASVRRPQYGNRRLGKAGKLSMMTPASNVTTCTTFSTVAASPCSHIPLATPLYAKNKKLPVNKVKLFQSVATSASTAKTIKQQQQQPPSSCFSSWRTAAAAYQAKK